MIVFISFTRNYQISKTLGNWVFSKNDFTRSFPGHWQCVRRICTLILHLWPQLFLLTQIVLVWVNLCWRFMPLKCEAKIHFKKLFIPIPFLLILAGPFKAGGFKAIREESSQPFRNSINLSPRCLLFSKFISVLLEVAHRWVRVARNLEKISYEESGRDFS